MQQATSPNAGPRILSGTAIAADILRRITAQTTELHSQHGLRPGIAAVIVGDDPASRLYVSAKTRKAALCGFHSEEHSLPSATTEAELLQLIATLNAEPAIHGILVQLPLPAHIDAFKVIQAIDPAKDVDGFHIENVGKLGTGYQKGRIVPCTPAGCMLLIHEALGEDLSGLDAVVIGRSNIVGKPMANLLFEAHATVTGAHIRSRNLKDLCRRADIIVVATGCPGLVQGDWVKPGAVVIDVGINRVATPEGTRIVGDVDFAACSAHAGAITPVPGGVGPMTIAMLMVNTLAAATRRAEEA